jgi:hypothetical protein
MTCTGLQCSLKGDCIYDRVPNLRSSEVVLMGMETDKCFSTLRKDYSRLFTSYLFSWIGSTVF